MTNHIKEDHPNSVGAPNITADGINENNESDDYFHEYEPEMPDDEGEGKNDERPILMMRERDYEDGVNLPTVDETINQDGNNDDDDAYVNFLMEMEIEREETVSVVDYEVPHTFPMPVAGKVLTPLNLFKPFSDDETNAYFWQDYMCHNINGEWHGGFKGIAWRTIFRKPMYGVENMCDLRDTCLLFNMADHVLNNGADQQETFFDIIEDILDKSGNFDASVMLPTSRKDGNAILLNGKFGLFNNLPHEPVMEIGGHACISLIEKLKHLMAHGIPIEFTETPTPDGSGTTREQKGVHGCPAMEELLEKMKLLNPNLKPTHYGHFVLWSDGFLRSFVKQKDNSVWILTITIPDPAGSATSPFHTHCLAIGKSSLDHSPVISYYTEEIEKLMGGIDMYCGTSGEYIRVQMGLAAYVCDRVERSALMKTAHLGTYGLRSLYSAEIDDKRLPFCTRCFRTLIESLLQDRYNTDPIAPCRQCCQWNMETLSPSAENIIPPELYPTSCHPESPPIPEDRPMRASFIRPRRMTFDWLRSAVNLAEHNVRTKFWNKGVMVDYLKTCCVPEKVRDLIWGKYNKKRTTADRNLRASVANVEMNQQVHCDATTNVVSCVPMLWNSSIILDAFIDAGMHHLFHGIVADVMAAAHEFMTHHNLLASFERLVNPYLIELQVLRLDWCRMKCLPKKQWLAEDELGFSRILPFIYAQFFIHVKLPESSYTTEATLMALQQMFNSLHVVIGLLMSPRDPKVETIDLHIKIFLSCCHRFVLSYYEPGCVPFWATTGNFPSMLNLRRQIENYGPIRLYWEGTRERFIQTVKKVLVSMRKTTSYFSKKLILIQKLNLMEWKKRSLRKARYENRKEYTRMYYRYDSLEIVANKLEKGGIISGFTLHGRPDWVYVAFGPDGNTLSMAPISLVHFGNSKRECGFIYGKCVLDSQKIIESMDRDEVESLMENYCLLLPHVSIDQNFEQHFAMVYHDWDIGNEFGMKLLPELCKVLFSIDVLAQSS